MTQPLTLDGLLALAEKATPGPWSRADHTGGQYSEQVCAPKPRGGTRIVARIASGIKQREGDVSYIAACSPEVVAALVRAVKSADNHFKHGADLYPDDYAEARAALDAAIRGKP